MEIYSIKDARNPEALMEEIERRYVEIQEEGKGYIIHTYPFPDKTRIDVYESSIVFTGREKDFYDLRELDMRLDTVPVETADQNSPTLAQVNFEHQVVGSDETGTGEIFKPMIVAAAYIKDEEDLRKFIRMGVNDSKKIEGKISAIGKAVTGVNSWEDIIDKPLFSNNRLAVRVISNEEINRRCHENGDKIDGVKEYLLKEAHLQVVKEMHRRHPESIVVVDDFTDGKRITQIKALLSEGTNAIPKKDVYMTTKADSKVMAVALASVICSYLCNLGIEYTLKQFNETYKKESVEPMKLKEFPKGSPSASAMKAFLENIKPEAKMEFVDKYAKKYYENVQKAL